MKTNLLHNLSYKIIRIILTPYIKYNLGFNFKKFDGVSSQYIVLSNHTNNLDPLLVSMSFPKHMYYIASEHIFRNGIISKILKTCFAPIMRVKAKTERRTAANIIKTLKNGNNLCMFAEGSTSWNGESVAITEATAKLIKKSGVALITYKIEGGYLFRPRWAKSNRRGKMFGRVVNEYTSNDLLNMTPKEIEEAINRDLYVNAYEVNKQLKIEYKGENLAENLENVLYICPNCKELGTLKSKGNNIRCNCGLDLKYNSFGIFENNNIDNTYFETILEWDKWQSNYIKDKKEDYKKDFIENYIVKDENQLLYKFEPGKDSVLISEGSLYLYSDRLEFRDLNGSITSFNLDIITDMALMMDTLITFTVEGKDYYEIKTKVPRSSLKYLMICKELTEIRTML